MYIYNVTINIDESIHEEFSTWIKAHIPQVLATGKFTEARLVQVLVEEEMGGTTYAVQYTAKSKEHLEAYYTEDAAKLREEGMKKFADKMLGFRTELRVIEDFKA
ncbi:hypothetical protein IMCC3317_34030 [Kordia antarctica]|uniref:DUF4286 domain-containing protein n=1 Tax=Kordia antarctica TaxID=1218801 RepID=A0A7L4ZNE4_9FLAO|nr:DUF4286 family protein [Kordia antarctica]QHI38020.1 hypothetical protein IMCC3317_34030 [Kordia antarctica]